MTNSNVGLCRPDYAADGGSDLIAQPLKVSQDYLRVQQFWGFRVAFQDKLRNYALRIEMRSAACKHLGTKIDGAPPLADGQL
jgi:hypothetical protein